MTFVLYVLAGVALLAGIAAAIWHQTPLTGAPVLWDGPEHEEDK